MHLTEDCCDQEQEVRWAANAHDFCGRWCWLASSCSAACFCSSAWIASDCPCTAASARCASIAASLTSSLAFVRVAASMASCKVRLGLLHSLRSGFQRTPCRFYMLDPTENFCHTLNIKIRCTWKPFKRTCILSATCHLLRLALQIRAYARGCMANALGRQHVCSMLDMERIVSSQKYDSQAQSTHVIALLGEAKLWPRDWA